MPSSQKTSRPLCVELDGTIFANDRAWESFAYELRRNPLMLFLIPIWLIKGKGYLKTVLNYRAKLNGGILPRNRAFARWLDEQIKTGRDVYLLSDSEDDAASSIAEKLGIRLAAYRNTDHPSDGEENRAQWLQEQFGESGFDYAGNGASDLADWELCHTSILVDPTPQLLRRIPSNNRIVINENSTSYLGALLSSLRPHQWIKNLLIFVPLLTAHAWHIPSAWASSAWAFLSFSLCASSVYLINDLADLESDRSHESKRNRPLASGALPIVWGFVASPILFLSSALVMLLINGGEGLSVLLIYFFVTCLYSFHLKQAAWIDIVLLAFVYTLRIVLGSEVIGVESSAWIIAFSFIFFLNLAMAKRYSEIFEARSEGKQRIIGRGYSTQDLNRLLFVGLFCAGVSLVILAFYVSSERAGVFYEEPSRLWAMVPILLAWISRIWLVTCRGQLHEDPILFAIKDWFSYLVLGFMIAVGYFASPIVAPLN